MSSYRFDRLKILVVDDSAHARTLVTTMLQAFGAAQVYEAANARQAYAILRAVNPDLIVLDWELDGMTGPELMQTIRTNALSPNPFVPVIMLTGHTAVDHIQQARDCGVNEFIAKPLSVQMLMSRLVSVIEHPRPFVRAGGYFGPCRRRPRFGGYHGTERRVAIEHHADASPSMTTE
ncbi:MAG TPA: response regulator [Rhizomicrobium sp.]|jgi:CheY-like chemotaxis protein